MHITKSKLAVVLPRRGIRRELGKVGQPPVASPLLLREQHVMKCFPDTLLMMGVAPRYLAGCRVLGAEGAPRARRCLGHTVTPPRA